MKNTLKSLMESLVEAEPHHRAPDMVVTMKALVTKAAALAKAGGITGRDAERFESYLLDASDAFYDAVDAMDWGTKGDIILRVKAMPGSIKSAADLKADFQELLAIIKTFEDAGEVQQDTEAKAAFRRAGIDIRNALKLIK